MGNRHRTPATPPRPTPVVVAPSFRPTGNGNGNRRVSDQEAARLREEWEALAEAKARMAAMERELAAKLDSQDISRPLVMGLDGPIPQPGSSAAMPVLSPSSPMPVSFTIKTWLVLLFAVASMMGTGAYFVASTKLHQTDSQRHLNPDNGAGWGKSADFETREEAREARAATVKAIEDKMDSSHKTLKDDLVRVLRVRYVPSRRGRRRAKRQRHQGLEGDPGKIRPGRKAGAFYHDPEGPL